MKATSQEEPLMSFIMQLPQSQGTIKQQETSSPMNNGRGVSYILLLNTKHWNNNCHKQAFTDLQVCNYSNEALDNI